MLLTGEGRMKIMVLAEAPGEQEDAKGTQLIGKAGQLLREALRTHKIDLDRDCRKTNAVRCRPPENRRPTQQEIAACAGHIWEEIEKTKPKVLLLLGQVAVESFLLGRVTDVDTIGKWRGLIIPDQKAGCWVCPTFHPSYILRSREGRAIRGRTEPELTAEERVFRIDLMNAIDMLAVPFPVAPVPKLIGFADAKMGGTLAIDYETTGLKPYRRGHKIVSVGVSDGEWATSFPLAGGLAPGWKKLLADPDVRKVGHNIKFEHQWAARCLGVETQGWVWDTMLAAHMIDNRRHFCGLKHQVYANFGVTTWANEVGGELKADGAHAFNSLKDNPPSRALLEYNALDAFWTMRLYRQQRKAFYK
jgi:DNA polymerase